MLIMTSKQVILASLHFIKFMNFHEKKLSTTFILQNNVDFPKRTFPHKHPLSMGTFRRNGDFEFSFINQNLSKSTQLNCNR